ncbi:MAG: rhodanese-like domain-containing protein [Myxococcota bacterium]|nr:rhodanese-like domain-containing protein [Myxococcota bacterium]
MSGAARGAMGRNDARGWWLVLVAIVLAACDDGGAGPADGSRDVPGDAYGGDADTDAADVETGAPDVDLADDAAGSETDVPPADAWPDDGAGEVACDPETVGWDTVLVLTAAQLHDLLAVEDPILINVFDADIPEIPGTEIQIPYTDLDAIEAFLGHDPCADLVLYCRRGVRSGDVGAALVDRGYRFVRVLEGGIEAWQAAGYPTEP